MFSHIRSIVAASRSRNSTGNSTRPGITFGAPRSAFHVADGTYLAARFRAYDVADRQQVFRSCSERVLAAIHGRRACMVRETRRDALPPLETHNSLYDADLN